MSETVHTFCRICEPSCGLVAELEGGQLRRLRPDKSHPVTRGFACHKGLGFIDVHRDPDRLNEPLRRGAQGFEALTWEQALEEIAGKLQGVVERHGPQAVAAYVGNPAAFSTLATQSLTQVMTGLGSRRLFNAGTQDCANKFAGGEAVFGTATLHPVPDLERTDYALIFGENPAVSHMSFLSIARPMEVLKAARARGATIRFVNPRWIESAGPATGDVLQIKPDTDLYLMAALLHEIDRAGLFDQDVIARHGRHLQGLRDFIAPYDARSVAPVVGLDADEIRRTALDFARAPSACVHMSTGVNMGRQGTLCYWLLQMLSFCTGNLDRPGGNLYAAGFYPAAKAGRTRGENPFFDSEFGPLRTTLGALPGNLLADMIANAQQPIRALIVLAGNPLLSIAGEQCLREAFADLELLVVLDLYRTATGELADYLLPCADMLEREDLNICGLGMQHQPFVQYTPAVVPPAHARREEWWILGKLGEALGLAPFDARARAQKFARQDHMLAASDLDLASVQAAPGGTHVLPEPATGEFFSRWIQTPDRKVDCCPAVFAAALERAHEIFHQLQGESDGALKLINLRTPYMHNSWFQNVDKFKRDRQRDNPLHLHPADAARLALQEGDEVVVRNDWGELRCRVRLDDSLRTGVVAMTHGWGNAGSPGLSVARRYPGVNVNRLLPRGPGSYETLSNQAHMTGVPVEVSAAVGA